MTAVSDNCNTSDIKKKKKRRKHLFLADVLVELVESKPMVELSWWNCAGGTVLVELVEGKLMVELCWWNWQRGNWMDEVNVT